MKKIVVLESSPVWQREFQRLCVHLTSFLQDDCLAIRHVGSTAVPGLAAKPVLDIDIVMSTAHDLDKVRPILEKRGYYFRGDLGIKGRYAFGYGSSSFMRHHLYVVKPQAGSYLDHLALREGLKADPSAIERYAIVKRALAKQFIFDIDAYIEGKSEVIQAIMSSSAGRKAQMLNGQVHKKTCLNDNLILLETNGDFLGEILFTKHPFEIVKIKGCDEVKEHLISFAKEISLGYQ